MFFLKSKLNSHQSSNNITLKISKGLDLPYYYEGSKEIQKSKIPQKVSLAGWDYPNQLHLEVQVGSYVQRGDQVFTLKEDPSISIVSPVSGRITEINRGEKRALVSVGIQVESVDSPSPRKFSGKIAESHRQDLVSYLANSGAWVYFRTRPFSLIPKTSEIPAAIFVNGMDTRPGSCGMKTLLAGREKALQKGLEVALALTNGKVYYCYSKKEYPYGFRKEYFQGLEVGSIPSESLERFQEVAVLGKHPAGLPSTHIHFLEPVSLYKTVWTIPATLLADIGELILTGVLPNKTRVSLSGPYWKNPCILETIVGASVREIVQDFLPQPLGESWAREMGSFAFPSYRIISGSILYGWEATGPWDMLGRFHHQISILRSDVKREFMDWILPGFHKYSITRSALGRYFPHKILWNTSQNGSKRAMVPIGNYERVMPMDILPTQLLRALLTKDWEEAVELGALELEEEDLSLCTYVCPGKMDYGPMLREVLKIARKELL